MRRRKKSSYTSSSGPWLRAVRCLSDLAPLKELTVAHAEPKAQFDRIGNALPESKGAGRFVDRLVIEHMHLLRTTVPDLAPYQTVRAPFPEGGPLYPGAEITAQNHIQIAVRHNSCIRGYFLPRQL